MLCAGSGGNVQRYEPDVVGMHCRIALLLVAVAPLGAQDAREIVRKSVELDQSNWRRARDYTWTARRVERHLESDGRVKSEKSEAWETVVLYDEPHRKFTERNSKPLTAEELRKQQEKLDKEVAKLRDETPQQKQHRLASEEKAREKDREFLLEIPEVYNLRIEREEKIEGRPVWVISATPKAGYRPKRSDAKDLLKIKGTLWIDQAEYQWVRVEAESIDTFTFGIFLGRINPGAKLRFEQTRVNDEIWLPKRSFISGTGRIVGKKIVLEEEVTWSNFRKFRVESNIIPN
jgi:hypothetical protein